MKNILKETMFLMRTSRNWQMLFALVEDLVGGLSFEALLT
jgi:hypothetical protein